MVGQARVKIAEISPLLGAEKDGFIWAKSPFYMWIEITAQSHAVISIITFSHPFCNKKFPFAIPLKYYILRRFSGFASQRYLFSLVFAVTSPNRENYFRVDRRLIAKYTPATYKNMTV